MAFTTLTNAQLAVDKPATSAQALAFRDNPIAIAAGDAGAPRVKSLGMLTLIDADNALSTDAGGNALVAVDLGESRNAQIEYHTSISLNTGPNAGTSSITLQGSTDDVTYTDLQTLGGSTGVTVAVNRTGFFDGVAGASYRYFRLYASGDNDHDIAGSALIKCIGSAAT